MRRSIVVRCGDRSHLSSCFGPPANFTLQLTSGLASARRPSRLGRPIPLRRHVSCNSFVAASAALRQQPCRSAAASMKPLAAECEIR